MQFVVSMSVEAGILFSGCLRMRIKVYKNRSRLLSMRSVVLMDKTSELALMSYVSPPVDWLRQHKLNCAQCHYLNILSGLRRILFLFDVMSSHFKATFASKTEYKRTHRNRVEVVIARNSKQSWSLGPAKLITFDSLTLIRRKRQTHNMRDGTKPNRS